MTSITVAITKDSPEERRLRIVSWKISTGSWILKLLRVF